MAKNPYADSENLAELLWETEMVADKYSNGGLILIKTKMVGGHFLVHLKTIYYVKLRNLSIRTFQATNRLLVTFHEIPT
jgi:hypothetical protein